MSQLSQGQAVDRLTVSYGLLSGNSIAGYHYGQHETRNVLSYDFSKKMLKYGIASALEVTYSSLDQIIITKARLELNRINFGGGQLAVVLGDRYAKLPSRAGLGVGDIRALSLSYDRQWLRWDVWSGTPLDLYRRNSSFKARNVAGTELALKPGPWFTDKIYAAFLAYSEAADSLNSRAMVVGNLAEATLGTAYRISLMTGWKRRMERRQSGNIAYGSPTAELNLAWHGDDAGASGGFEFIGKNFLPLQASANFGPRFSGWYRPNDLVLLRADLANMNVQGDTNSSSITNSWGVGSNLVLPNLPKMDIMYRNSDQRIDFSNLPGTRYITTERTVDLSRKYRIIDLQLRYRLNDRDERRQNSQDYRLQAWRFQPVFALGRHRAWPSLEFENWSDARSTYRSRIERYRMGGDIHLWSYGQLWMETGFNNELYGTDPRQRRWAADVRLSMNLSTNYKLNLTWWNENNIAQDTGFFYRPDYNRFKMTVSRYFDLRGNNVDGLVFLDINKNGKQDRGEVGVPGIRVMSTTGQQAVTDARGRYVLNNLHNGSSTVKLDLTTLSAEYNIIGTYERTVPLGGWRSPRADFPLSTLGGIKGRVFYDRNKNGQFDADDFGIPGVTVILQPSQLAAVSNGGGTFRFSNVPTGEQELLVDTVSAPAEYELVSPEPKKITIKQGEIINHLEFGMTKRFRPVKKVVFEGEITVPLISVPEARAAELPRRPAPTPPPSVQPKPQPTTQPRPAPAPTMSKEEIDALYRDGTRLFSAGDYQAAMKIWQRILKADPGHANARRNLERTRQKLDALKKSKG